MTQFERPNKVLVVEDEVSIQKIVLTYLESAGFEVVCVDDGQTALERARLWQPDLIVLDLNLPGMDGMEVAARVRQMSRPLSDVYILMLTARDDEGDRVAGLKLGADDYLTKPFSPRELVARVEAILRRRRETVAKTAVLSFTHLTINATSHTATVGTTPLELTATEFQLLWELAQHAGRVLTRDQLLERVWGATFYGNDRVVDVYVGQVRRKLIQAAGVPLIETVRGVGYKFNDDLV